MFVIILCSILFLLFLLQKKVFTRLLNFKKLIDFSKTLPGPPIFELFANAKKEKVLLWQKHNRLTYGPVFKVWFGLDLFIFFSDPEDVQSILGNNQLLFKSKNYDMATPWLGRGLLTNSGESWRQRRKILTPAFHFKILSEFKAPMEECGNILINKLKNVADGKSFDIYPFITLYALDVICETAMGIKKHAQEDSDSEYVRAVQTICCSLHQRLYSFWQRIDFLYNLSSASKVQKACLEVLHGETKRVIELRREFLKTYSTNENEDSELIDIGAKKRLAFLDVLLVAQRDGSNLSDDDIREEVDTFMFEGHDTISSAISFAIYLLSKNPKEQQLAYLESVELEGKEAETMKYLEAVIKETLRLYPSVPFFSRKLHEDLQIRDMKIPAGTSITTFCYMVHRDPEIYPDPEKFDPNRFLVDGDRHPYANVAFSAGVRNCIGQKFAMLELKSTLAKLLREFEICPVENFEPIILAELVMKSGNGIQVSLKTRK